MENSRPPSLSDGLKRGSEPPTLAERIRFWREQRFLTPELLAIKAQLPLRTVEDIEAGIETFLSPTIRQRLARIFHVRPVQIRELEKVPKTPAGSADAPALQRLGRSLYQTILSNPDAPHACPLCKAMLSVRVFERRDLQNNPLTVIKAACTVCLFRLTDD